MLVSFPNWRIETKTAAAATDNIMRKEIANNI